MDMADAQSNSGSGPGKSWASKILEEPIEGATGRGPILGVHIEEALYDDC